MTVRDIAVAFGIDVDKKSVNTAESTIKNIKSIATKALGAIAIGFSFSALNSIAEEFNGINDTIRGATRELGDQEEIQQRILQAANDTKQSYGDMAGYVTQLVKMDQNLFGDVETATSFATQSVKALAAAGRSSSEISSAQSQLNRVFAQGELNASSFTRILRSYPELINTMAEGLNVTQDELAAMADAGRLSSETIVSAFSNASDKINSDFDELDYSISDAVTNIRNSWGLFVDQLWVGSGITNGVGKMMVRAFNGFLDILKKLQPYIERVIRFLLSGVSRAMDLISKVSSFIGRLVDKIGGVENVLKLVATIAGAIWLALNAGKILDFLKTVRTLMGGINLKMLAIIAVIVILALIIEDFINFMQGNDSVIGSLFEKAGIDADAARETIQQAWKTITGFLSSVWDGISEAAHEIFGELSEWWDENGEGILESLGGIWESLKELLSSLWESLSQKAHEVFDALQEFWDDWGGTIMSVFGTVWKTLVSLIQPFLDAVSALIGFITDVFTGDWEGAWENVKELFSAAWEAVSSILDGAAEIVATVLNGICENILGIDLSELAGKFEEGFQGAIDFITGLPEQALQWGADIINSIAEGITGAIGKVTEAVSGVGEKIKSFLHFSVPDEGPLADFQSWMPDFMRGMAEGIGANEDEVLNKVKGLAGGISVLIKGATASVRTAANGAVNNTSSTNVTQNNTFNNSYSGSDAQAQKNISNGMNKSAQDATDYLAKGLAYAR